MFLTEADYNVQVRTEIKNLLTGGSSETLEKAELAAQAEMESYLRARYDVAEIFNKTGAERHPVIIMYMIDVVLYHLHSNISPRNVPQLRMDRYDAAIKWLTMVSKEQINPDLPLLPDNESIVFKGGSREKYSEPW